MSPRHLISIPGRLIRVSLLLAVSVVILFFALTRTEVGREGLRGELERQFARSFNGRLEIESLTGNLLNRLSASEVRIFDDYGNLLLRVDSVVIHPSWRDLFRRTISTGRITLLHPELRLRRTASGSWNWKELFERPGSGGAPDPWSFHATHVEIVDGRVTTESEGPPPRLVDDGWLFDYTNAEIRAVNGRAIVDIGDDVKLIDILEAQVQLPAVGLAVDSLRGQLLLEDGRVSLAETHLSIGNSDLHLAGSLTRTSPGRTVSPDRPGSGAMELDLASSTLDADELSRLVPRLPLRDRFDASARIQGPLDELVVEQVIIQRGASRLRVEGTLVGLPDSVDFQLALLPGSVSSIDLAAVWPTAPFGDFRRLGPVTLEGVADGFIQFGDSAHNASLNGKTKIRLESRAGALDADLQVGLSDSMLLAAGTIQADNLDAGLLLRRPDLSSVLNGELVVDVAGPSLRESVGEVSLALGPSVFAGRRADSVSISLDRTATGLRAHLALREGAGSFVADVTADSLDSGATYRIQGRTEQFDVGNVFRVDSLASALNTTFLLAGRGTSPDAFEGAANITFAPSHLTYRGETRQIPAHVTTLEIDRATESVRTLTVGGDVVQISASGDLYQAVMAPAARYWGHALKAGLEQAYARSYRPDSSSAVVQAGLPSPNVGLPLPNTSPVPGFLSESNREPRSIDARVEIVRSDILSALIPILPPLYTDAVADIGLQFQGDSASLQVEIAADSLDIGTFRSEALEFGLRADATHADSLAENLDAQLLATSSSIAVGSRRLVAPKLDATYNGSGMDLLLRADVPGAAEPFRLDARLDLLEDRNRITIDELQLSARDETWHNPEPAIIDLYQDALVVNGVRIGRRPKTLPPPDSIGGSGSGQVDIEGRAEQVFVSGVLSSAPQDTLFLRADGLSLEHLTGMLPGEYPLSGRLDGGLAFTGFNRQPELTGTLEVTPLAFEDRVLGTLTVTSRYIPGLPDVALRARLEPAESAPPNMIVEPSVLEVGGTFRLPGGRTREGMRDPGALDLDVLVERADAFFFEYIFAETVDDVSGVLTGSGHIGGNFDFPLFDAELELVDGGFRVPEFRLDYIASGPVRVDAAGIHLDDIRVQDPRGGTALVSGSVLFNEYRFFSLDLVGYLDELRIMNVSQSRDLPFYGRIRTSGTVTLTGPLANASLRSSDVVTTSDSELYIPITESTTGTDAGFIVFADSTGRLPDLSQLTRRRSVLAARPVGERLFLDGLDIDLDISAPEGSTVHLVIDPLLGDVINAVGSGRIQLLRNEGEFSTFGRFNVSSGDYLFTAGEVFYRRFLIENGAITWDGDPLNAILDIAASFRTRASTEGLGLETTQGFIPLLIRMNVTGRVSTPTVDLALAIDRDDRRMIGGYEGIEAMLNQPEHAAQYATSVLLTNSFLLTTASESQLSDTRNQLAFNSLSQLVASQLNRYLNYALPNVDLNFGVQGESTQDLDVTYGVALRLLDERLIIRGQGIYQSNQLRRSDQGVLDEFVVEIRMNPRVSVEMFYRKEGDILTTDNTSTTGAGLSYQTEFSTWGRLMERLFGWIVSPPDEPPPPEDPVEDEPPDDEGEGVVAGRDES